MLHQFFPCCFLFWLDIFFFFFLGVCISRLAMSWIRYGWSLVSEVVLAFLILFYQDQVCLKSIVLKLEMEQTCLRSLFPYHATYSQGMSWGIIESMETYHFYLIKCTSLSGYTCTVNVHLNGSIFFSFSFFAFILLFWVKWCFAFGFFVKSGLSFANSVFGFMPLTCANEVYQYLLKLLILYRCIWGCCFWAYTITNSWRDCLFCLCTSFGMFVCLIFYSSEGNFNAELIAFILAVKYTMCDYHLHWYPESFKFSTL